MPTPDCRSTGHSVVPAHQVAAVYYRYQWLVFLGIYFGYAALYLIRRNFTLSYPPLMQEGWSKATLGLAWMWFGISYGVCKFFMSILSDRSNPRYFMTASLVFSALVCIVLGGWPRATENFLVMSSLLLLMGLAQGMGFPPCATVLMHWWPKATRGRVMGFWNTSHNLGGAIMPFLPRIGAALFGITAWRTGLFILPGCLVLVLSPLVFFLLRGKPVSCGLPKVEVYHQEVSEKGVGDQTRLSPKEIFWVYILANPYIWCLTLANAFTYWLRFGVDDWAPTYLCEVKLFSETQMHWSRSVFELAGIPGALLCGWISDRMPSRVWAGVLFMTMVTVSVALYALLPPQHPYLIMLAIVSIGFFIYGPMMLYGLCAMEIVPKFVAGTVTGFIGLFGYLFGSLMASMVLGIVSDKFGWAYVMGLLVAAGIICIILMVAASFPAKEAKRSPRAL